MSGWTPKSNDSILVQNNVYTGTNTFNTGNLKVQGSSTGVNSIATNNSSSTNYTNSLPAQTGILATTTGSNLYYADITTCTSAQTANSNTTYANITGLTQEVVPGTYRFQIILYTTVASGTAGIKIAFNYTTTVLSSLNATSTAWVAAGTGCQNTTNTTTQANLYAQAAAILKIQIDGRMIVSTGGTIDLQMAQQVSNGSDSTVNIGSTMEFIRIS